MPRKIAKKERGLFERVPGSGIWWIRYEIAGIERREKVGRRGDVIKLYLMDAIGERFRDAGVPHEEQFRHDLLPLVEVCRWTDGYWDFGPGVQRKWNEVQNTPKDIQILANYLMVQYKALVWSRPHTRE